MKRVNFFLFIILFSISTFLISCGNSGNGHENETEDSTTVSEEVDEFQLLVNYLEENGDFINTKSPAIVKAAEVYENIDKYYIMDIRKTEDFATGHIKNAVNVPKEEILNHMKELNSADYEKIVIACYSGHTAGFTTGILRLSGYENVYSMKWGMCSWNAEISPAKWSKKPSNKFAEQTETTINEKNPAGDYPIINTGKTTGKEILEARIEEVFAKSFKDYKISSDKLFETGNDFYIINYWKTEDYTKAHIPGAIQYAPKSSLSSKAELNTIPTNKTIAAYCYTGQGSTFVVAYLAILGYDAKYLTYGTNGFMNELMKENEISHIFTDKEINKFPYEKSQVSE